MNEVAKGGQVVLGLELSPVGRAEQVARANSVLAVVRNQEGLAGAWIVSQKALTVRVAKQPHDAGEIVFDALWQILRKGSDVAVLKVGLKGFTTFRADFLGYTLKPLDEASSVVRPVLVPVDGFDNLTESPGGLERRLARERGRLSEVLEQGSIEAIEHREVRLVDLLREP